MPDKPKASAKKKAAGTKSPKPKATKSLSDCKSVEELEKLIKAMGKDAQVRKVVKSLLVPITDEAKILMGDEMAKAIEECGELAQRKKETAADFTSRINSRTTRTKEISESLQKGTNDEDIDCKEIMDYAAGKLIVIRLDTLKQVAMRELTQSEKQMYIDATEPKGKPNAKDKGDGKDGDKSTPAKK